MGRLNSLREQHLCASVVNPSLSRLDRGNEAVEQVLGGKAQLAGQCRAVAGQKGEPPRHRGHRAQ